MKRLLHLFHIAFKVSAINNSLCVHNLTTLSTLSRARHDLRIKDHKISQKKVTLTVATLCFMVFVSPQPAGLAGSVGAAEDPAASVVCSCLVESGDAGGWIQLGWFETV